MSCFRLILLSFNLSKSSINLYSSEYEVQFQEKAWSILLYITYSYFLIVDSHLMPLFWQGSGYWQFSGRLAVVVINQVTWCQGETAEPRGCLSFREHGSHPPAQVCYIYTMYPICMCLNEKVVLIIFLPP